METILGVLKAMEKATAREIAARMKIEPAAVIGMLREHEERNEVIQVNGYWKVATGEVKSQPTAASSVSKTPASVSVSDVIALLAEHGPQTSELVRELASALTISKLFLFAKFITVMAVTVSAFMLVASPGKAITVPRQSCWCRFSTNWGNPREYYLWFSM